MVMKFCRHVNILVTIIFRWGLIGWVTETLENIEQNETDKAEVETEIQGRILNETENGMKKRDRQERKKKEIQYLVASSAVHCKRSQISKRHVHPCVIKVLTTCHFLRSIMLTTRRFIDQSHTEEGWQEF